MKKFFLLLLSLITVVSLVSMNSVTAYAAENIAESNAIEIVKGSDVIVDTVVLMGDYVCTTTDSEESSVISPYAYTEKEKTKSFVHNITDRNGALVAKFTTTVYGVYSYADDYATIISVSGSFSDAALSGLGYTVSYNGDTATVYITKNGLAIGSITYKLYTNGSLFEI